jgi:hypothetical protein
VLSVAVFSEIEVAGFRLGYGSVVFRTLHDFSWAAHLAAGCAAVLLVLLYLLDCSYWNSNWRVIKCALIGVSILAILAGAVLSVEVYPVAPLAVYLLSYPFWLLTLKHFLYWRTPVPNFLAATALFLLLTSLGTAGLWCVKILITQ